MSTAICLRIAEKNTVNSLLRMRERRLCRETDQIFDVPSQVTRKNQGTTNKQFTLERV